MAFRTSARSVSSSPTRRKRGNAGRTSSGVVDTSSFVASPTRMSPLTARTCIRQVVRLSGIVTATDAFPSSSVTSCASQYAVLRNCWRRRGSSRPPPPLPPADGSVITSFDRSIETDSEEPVATPKPRSNQKARSPVVERSLVSDSTALSTTATDNSERTPRPVWSLTSMSYRTVSPGCARSTPGVMLTSSRRTCVDTGSST